MIRQIACFIVVLVLPILGYCQKIEKECQNYYLVCDRHKAVDILKCSNKYIITNDQKTTCVLMFTNDDITQISAEKAIARSCFGRYLDFSLSDLACESTMVVESFIPIFPYCFIKILEPNESFEMIINAKAEEVDDVNRYMNNHLLFCTSELVCKSVSSDFIRGVKNRSIGYPPNFISLEWNDIKPVSKLIIRK